MGERLFAHMISFSETHTNQTEAGLYFEFCTIIRTLTFIHTIYHRGWPDAMVGL